MGGGSGDAIAIGDVDVQGTDTTPLGGGFGSEPFNFPRIHIAANTGEDVETQAGQMKRGGPADTGACARDQNMPPMIPKDRHGFVIHTLSSLAQQRANLNLKNLLCIGRDFVSAE
jgi:hypothetical protein